MQFSGRAAWASCGWSPGRLLSVHGFLDAIFVPTSSHLQLQQGLPMKRTAKISKSCAMAGLGLTALGIGLSGGVGPCGPPKTGTFFLGVFGAVGFRLRSIGLFVVWFVLFFPTIVPRSCP